MPTSSPLKVGVVGAGVGRMHLRAYQALENVEVVALCDVDETRLTQVGDLFNITYRYTDYKTMFEAGMIEAVSICLPNSLHAPVSLAAL
ncbi:MAG TPA: Gfo/Idh/MocA family oxidoreductase, partial [Anaerolineae bacterium]|nr:Gfo/Idh/MocA family oxidoreductase [Anaerolineae bacterium]